MTETPRTGVATRLVLPVPELRDTVPDAHVTLLAPFLPAVLVDAGVEEELAEFFAGVVPFAYVLGDPVRFPNGAAYLPPRPVGTFRRLAQELRRAFPEVVAPTASLDTVVPHLSLPEGVLPATPVEVHAREARLLAREELLASFAFGTSAA